MISTIDLVAGDVETQTPKTVRQRRALIRRGLAIHRAVLVYPDGTTTWDGWGLTHVRSGLSAYWSHSLPRVRRMMELCFAIRANWDVDEGVFTPEQRRELLLARDRLKLEDAYEEVYGC